MEKWWVIRGVKNPVYVGLETSRETRVTRYVLLALVILVLLTFFLESINVVPSGLSLTAITLSALIQVLFNLFGWGRRIPSKNDIVYITNLVKLLNGNLVKWCIPSKTIPLLAVLDNGVNLILFYRNSNLNILLLKPIVYKRVVSGKPVVKLKWIKRFKEKFIEKGEAETTYPHPDFPRVNYIARARAIHLDIVVENSALLKIVESFDREASGEEMRVHISDRRHAYTGSSRPRTG